MSSRIITTVAVATLVIFLGSCDKKDLKLGIGPVKKVELTAPIDAKMVEEGKGLFQLKCSACHELGQRKVGPAMHGVTQRRTPEWIMNMILNPAEMLKEDPQAKELLETYLVPMTFQNVSQEDTRKMLEFFRDADSKPLNSGPASDQKK
mgnify:CR=1 FL=1